MNLLNIHTHLLHNFHTITEGEHDTLLGCTNQMSLRMFIEVHTINRASNLFVLQNALSTITKRNNSYAFTTDRRLCSQVVHLCIANLRSNVTMSPSIQNTRTINTKQNTQASLVCRMIHVSKSVYTRLWVIINITQNAVNHTRCSSCCCYLTRIQYVQRQGIVRLVTTTISNRCTCL